MITINLVGDIMLGELLETYKRGVRTKIINGTDPFEYCKTELENSDLNIGNLESVLSENSERKGIWKDIIRADKQSVNLLKQAKFNVLNLANNHISDHGRDALNDTRKILDENGIKSIGEREFEYNQQSLLMEMKGIKVAVLAYYLDENLKNEIYNEYVNEIIKNCDITKKDCDILIMSLHWGSEYCFFPKAKYIETAKELFSAGVDIIYGHHPHWIHGVIQVDNKIFAPSMGNFVFDDCRRKSKITQMLSVNYDEDSRKLSFRQIPFLINKNYQPVHDLSLMKYIDKLNDKLKIIFSADKIDAERYSLESMKQSQRGHLMNRIKIRILFVLFIFHYLSYLKTIIFGGRR